MRWEADVARGTWIVERLDDAWRDMHGAVPRGFAAYARVFHPVEADRPVGATWHEVGARAQWHREIDKRSATWREVAAKSGATWHPLMQWQKVSRPEPGGLVEIDRVGGIVGAEGWRYSDPVPGNPGVETVAAIARVLAAHTSTPHDGAAAVWEGWGGLFENSSWSVLVFADATAGRHRGDDGIDADGHLPPAAPAPRAPEVEHGPRLRLPWRDHLLFDAGITEFAGDWPRRAPWARHPQSPEAPSLIWPEDRVWIVVSEIDWDSTIVAGSRAAIDAVLAAPTLEALEIPPRADLSSAGDAING